MGAPRRSNALWAEVNKKDYMLMMLISDRKLRIYPRKQSHWIRIGKNFSQVEAMQLGLPVTDGSKLWPNLSGDPGTKNPNRGLDPSLAPYHDVEDVAEAVGVGPERIRQMIKAVELEAYKPSKAFRIPDRALKALVQRLQPLPTDRGELIHLVPAIVEFTEKTGVNKVLLQLDCERGEVECYRQRGKGPYFIPRAALDARIAYYQERQRANQSQSA